MSQVLLLQSGIRGVRTCRLTAGIVSLPMPPLTPGLHHIAVMVVEGMSLLLPMWLGPPLLLNVGEGAEGEALLGEGEEGQEEHGVGDGARIGPSPFLALLRMYWEGSLFLLLLPFLLPFLRVLGFRFRVLGFRV